jgi:hypothetical protein
MPDKREQEKVLFKKLRRRPRKKPFRRIGRAFENDDAKEADLENYFS